MERVYNLWNIIQFLLDFLLQGCFEEIEQEVLLTLIGSVVVQCENHGIHELGRFVLGHLKDQLGQIGWICLRKTERKMNRPAETLIFKQLLD